MIDYRFDDDICCYVYVLRCDYKIFYTGITNNINRRIKEHRATRTGYTRLFDKKEIVFIYKLLDRKEARKLEIYIKSIGAKRFLIINERSINKDPNTKLYMKQLLLTKT